MDAAASASHPALAALMERVRAAHADATPLALRGSGSKAFYGEPPRGEPLDLRPLAGISSYEPTELVVTALAGTPLAELEAVLAERGLTLDDCVKTTVHLADLADFAEFNSAYQEFFTAPYPVRTTVGSQLANILVEIDVVAALPAP